MTIREKHALSAPTGLWKEKTGSILESPTFISQGLMAGAGIGAGATAGALVDDENRGRGAVTGGLLGGLLHAPYIATKLRDQGAASHFLIDAAHKPLLQHPAAMLAAPAAVGGVVGGTGTALLDYSRLRGQRNTGEDSVKEGSVYRHGRTQARVNLGL